MSLATVALQFDRHWHQIDQVIGALNTTQERISAWEAIADLLTSHPVSKAIPFFRLGILHLVTDTNEAGAIRYLERAYNEDVKYGPDVGQTPHRMGEYRLLALTKGFIEHLRSRKNWETEQLAPPHRAIVIRTVLAVYDRSLAHILDMEGHTYPSFFAVIQDKGLVRFAIENYFFAERLIELFFVSGAHISRFTDEYPLARSVVGLFGGVLEAILADKLPHVRGKPLGTLMTEAHGAGIVRIGTKLAALSSMMLYLRNHVHPDRDAARTAYSSTLTSPKAARLLLIGSLPTSQIRCPKILANATSHSAASFVANRATRKVHQRLENDSGYRGPA